MKAKFTLSYAYAVCFSSTIFLIISLATFVIAALEVSWPRLMVEEYVKTTHYDNETFLRENENYYKDKTPEALTELREKSFQYQLQLTKEQGVKKMLYSGIYFLIGLFFFISHWRIAKNLKDREG